MIKKEFGVRIELDDDQVMARVFAYAAQSGSTDLKDCANALMQQLIPDSDENGNEKDPLTLSSAARIYRGQVILDDEKSQAADSKEKGSQPGKKNVIYRGRRVG